jgi:uncharacterized membrane protein
MAEQSETFDNVAWVKTTDGQVTISANATTAPNGTSTADKMIASANAGFHCVAQTQSLVAGVFTISIYAKASEYTFLQIFDSLTTDFANFNLTTGAVATVDTYTATMENVGNGWYRCTATKTTPSGNFVFRYGIVTTGTATRGESFTGNGVNGLFVWGAQINIGSTAKPYFPTTDRLNVPRLTYQNGGGGCPSLLLEPQRTNLAEYSNALSTAPNVVDASTTTANVYVSPDGTQNAMRFTETTVNDRHGFYQYTTVTAQTYTASIFTKQTGRRYISFLSDVKGVADAAYFDLQTKTAINVSSGYSCSVEDFGNGWLRLIVTFTASAGFRYVIWGGSPDGSSTYYAGNTSISQTFYGYQLEAGSYATSYIPTTSSSATRVADACFKTGISSLIGQTEGVIFLDYDRNNSEGYADIFLSDGSYSNIAYWDNANKNFYFIVSGYSTKALNDSSIGIGRYKIAVAYKSGDYVLYVNGVQKATDTTTGVPPMSQIGLSTEQTIPRGQGNPINQVALFKTRLTNAELASLTTI